jgi:hypothetical protein
MNKTVAALSLAVLSAFSLGAAEWMNLADENYYSGPKIKAEDLVGKVVLVDEWGVNCPPCRALLPAMQSLWNSNKTKPFILLGSHRQGRSDSKVKELVEANKLTYPIYERAGLSVEPDNDGGLPFMYVLDHRGKVVYSGRSHDEVVSAVQKAIAAIGSMPVLCGGVQLQAFKSMEKQLVLGKAIKAPVKTLQAAVKKGSAKNATAVQQRQAEEAKAILAAIDEAKGDVKNEIEAKRTSNPEEALKLVRAYITTFPAEGAEYKAELPELSAKAAEWKKAKK